MQEKARLVVVLLIVSMVSGAWGRPFFYAYVGDAVSGLGAIEVDAETGKFSGHRSLAEFPVSLVPDKIRLSKGGMVVGVSLQGGKDGAYAIHNLETGENLKLLALDFEPVEHRGFGDSFLVAGSKGHLVVIDATTGRVRASWNARESLQPSGHKVEDIQISRDGSKAALSFQKDSSSGKHLGSRLVWIDLPKLDHWVDLEIPRSRPDLHMEGTLKEVGPNPEVIRLEEESNTILMTLDLYGALWLADLNASLEGKWRNTTMVPTAQDRGWGNSFPDRLGRFTHNGEGYYLVINAGDDTGFGIFRLRDRSFVGFQDSLVGAEEPIYFPKSERIATAVSGKVKVRGEGGLNKFYEPDYLMRIFHIDEWNGEGPLPETEVGLPGVASRIVGLFGERSIALLAVDGEGHGGTSWALVTVDVETGEILDKIETLGMVTRLE
ncbi:MAG: hypothetical protein ACFCU4_03725 [Puniceicoccaceae bacterium]